MQPTIQSFARRRASRLLAGVTILSLANALFVTAEASADPVIAGTGTFTYEQGDPPLNIGDGLTVADGLSYGGQFVEFAVESSTASESLSLISVASADSTSGEVSIVGDDVYLGNGTTADVVGTIDATDDGEGGRTLRINFTDEFVNAGFEDGLTGWTVVDQRINLGVDSIASCPTIDRSTYPGTVPNQDNSAPGLAGTRSTTVVTSEFTQGTQAAQIQVNDMVTNADFDVVHGPAIFSSPFDAALGDQLAFDWMGIEGDGDYHVFGYLIDSGCTQTDILDATGAGPGAWTPEVTTIPVTGTYRAVFVNGTFNRLGGQSAGASLLVDNVRVDGSPITDDVAQQVVRKLEYANSAFAAAASRTIDVTVQSALEGTAFGAITVDLVLAPIVPPTTGSPGASGSDARYVGLVPSRLWDSRSSVKPVAASVRELVVRGQGGVPSDATAVVLNVTVDRPDAWGFVTVFPCGGDLPLASNVNFEAGQTVANAVTVAVDAAGKVCVYTSVAAHLIVDVNGAFSPSEGTGLLVAGLSPSRLWDSRTGAKPTAKSVHEFVVRGQGGVPADATAVVLNVTADGPDGTGFVTVFPCGGDSVPLASNVNYVAGQTVANAVTVAVGVVGRVCVYTSAAAHLIVDVNGAFSPTEGTGLLIGGIAPSRLWDSRGGAKPVANSVRELVVAGQGGVPADATAVVLNVTVDGPDGTGFVTVFPCGVVSVPLASNVNYVADQTVANAVTVAVGVAGRVCVYTSAATHLIVDTNAAFAP